MLLAAAASAETEKTLTILGTSDIHGNIWGYSYEDNEETDNNGFARLYSYIQQLRAENENVILVDNGDLIQGNILTNDLYNKAGDGEHPLVAVMNFAGYDAMVPGNHEFNWGVPTMLGILDKCDFPVLCANVRDAGGEYLSGAGWTIVERDGVRVAIIGVVTPAVPIWDEDKEGVCDYSYESASAAVSKAIGEIGDRADVIMVSAHMGMYPEFYEESGADSAQKILDENPGVDVLLVGHMHIVVNDKQGACVIGAPRNDGRDIVRFDLRLDENNNIIDSGVQVVDMSGVEPSEAIRQLPIVIESHENTISFVSGSSEDGPGGAPLGETTARFQPENEIRGIPAGHIMDTAVPDLINRIQLERSGADVSATALFKSSSDLPGGAISYGNIFDIYKYDNVLYRVPVTGAELKAYMEWSARYYNQWTPGDINISFDPDVPDYLYDVFAGVDYEIDVSQPKGQRIRNVMFRGEPLEDDQELTLAVNNFRYSAALKTYNLVSGKKEWESSCSIRDMIVEYFEENSPVTPTVDGNWRIVGVDLELDNPLRAELVEKINSGEIESPSNKSLNISDYIE